MVHFLEVPAVFAGARLERDDRGGEQVVAGANRTVEIGAGITGREVDEPELGIDGRRIPHRGAAVHPDLVVLRPGIVAELARTRNRIERPKQLAVAGVVCFDAPAHPDLGTRKARDDHAVVIERRTRDGEALLPTLGLNRPNFVSRALIERNEPAVEETREDL